VSGISFTSPPTAGVRTTALVRVTNVGNAPSGQWITRWFVEDIQGLGIHLDGLAPGQQSVERFEWTPTPGVHTLRFEVAGGPELNEGNNSATVTVRVLPDLRVSGISFTRPPTAGVETTALVRVTNVGRAPSGPFRTRWVLPDRTGGVGFDGLDPGQQQVFTALWTPTPGTHTLRFDADVDHRVAELNEGNNSATITVRVLPDLRVSGISFTSTPTAGVRTTAVARLSNAGRAPSGEFNVKWFLDGAQVGYGRHKSLAAGEISNDNIRFSWTPAPGWHRLRFHADVDNEVSELDEGNNSAAVTVRAR
jgi:subtilase family serine protease